MTQFEGVAELVEPVMIAAFEGWNDAGEAASGVIDHLAEVWQARPLLALDPDDYYDFQVHRPDVEMVDENTRRITWPTTRLSVARAPESGRDLVLVRGIEPNMRWRGFCGDLLNIARELGVHQIVLLGALLADAPHTRPVPVSGSASDPALARSLNLDITQYEGPTGIVGVLQETAAQAGMEAISLWGAIPHYVAQPPCPKGSLALLRRVEDVLDLAVPQGDLPEQARAWERGVDELAAEDSEIASYVRSLEEAKDAADLPEASGEAIAREFERYLRRRGPSGEK
ncbi:PAC2 family protein [Allonocardiopsis opalescens]|uniref:Proteasome assembly chaperone (PAC2) family protein n=1 Tax=Allonocardiopsis opalescens TaxID=1144618 RepID=A0A2T0Q445_9ACTN|nr:PAC2 family protein [Allonocardiopsis opalescens]PRX98569.1 proteasome assembly chaperone (PAC2) family protein [Allonocardiopsis opalescens]